MARKRRPAGTGSVYRDGDYFAAQVVAGRDKNGRTRYRKKRSKRESEVVAWLNAQLAAGGAALPNATVEQVLTPWLDQQQQVVRYGTHRSYAQLLRDHVFPRIGTLPIMQLTVVHVQAILDALHRAGRAYNTIRNVRACLRAAFRSVARAYPNALAAVEESRIPRDHTAPRQRVARALTPEQAQRLLIAVANDRLKALYWTALLLGLRQGELLALRVADLDLDNQTIRVREQVQRQAGRGLVRVATKTPASTALLPLPDVLMPVLREQLALLAEERWYAGWREQGLLFPTTVGTPYSGSNVWRHLQKTLERAGLPQVSFHSLRHTTATLLVALGVHPRITMEIMRHTQISTTMNIYAEALPAANRDAVNALGALVEPATIELPEKARRQ